MFWLDIAILTLLTLGAVLGFWSGLLWQVARLLSLGVSLYATLVFNEPVTQLLHEHVAPEAHLGLLRAVAYGGMFLGTYILLFTLTRLLHRTIQATKLESLDRLMGAALGTGKMVLLLAPACAGLAYLALPITQEWMEKSTLAPLLARGMHDALVVIPEDYRHQAEESIQHVRDRLQNEAVDRALDAIGDELKS
jgi:uncharacterized membrane protein required for colicin V production